MKEYQVRSTFISTRVLLILCILILVNTVVAGMFLIGPYHGEWFSILISIYLIVFLAVILFDSRTVKQCKISREKIIVVSRVVTPNDLLRITITHKQIELIQAENMNFRKLLLIRMVHPEELDSLTEDVLEFAKEHGITIENKS